MVELSGDPLVGRKLAKLGRKIKTSAYVMRSLLSRDYSGRRLTFAWDALPSRFDLANQLIATHHYHRYLEIGCSTDACFQNVEARYKIGVDPVSGGTHRMTSDAFFATNQEKFDLIFVDGLHQYAQVKRDLVNSLQALNEGGIILVHDCLPLTYRAQLPFPAGGAWNGNVWKSFVEIRTRPDADAAVCVIDHGVGLIRKRSNQNRLNIAPGRFVELRFRDFVEKYQEWLNTISFEKALTF
jgi:hypothetical protein